MFVACSSLCFGKQSLDDALRRMGEMRFNKVDLSVHSRGHHLTPAAVAADVPRMAQKLKSFNVAYAALQVVIEAQPPELDLQFRAVCRLARLVSAPVVTVPAPAVHTPMAEAVAAMNHLAKIASSEGVILAVETLAGTITEQPATAAELCKKVPGLTLSLDPSHFVAGPAHSHNFDVVFPHVKHVRLRDTGARPEEFQVRVGQGQIDYGKIVSMLERYGYERALTVDVRDTPEASFDVDAEVRKLKYLLESLV